ncbi:MAG TPA: XdhC family protein, partial [Flavobacteriales bacterium]|nr:XdhC family protein [Flavobacteriales bacterium]
FLRGTGAAKRSLNTAVNKPHEFWDKALQALRAEECVVLMIVTESSGSSPGRAGFKMFVGSSGAMHGSIGGGSMEHKLVELARSLTGQPTAFPFLKKQVHREGEARDRSGMICSGEQTVAFYLLTRSEIDPIERIASCSDPEARIEFSEMGIRLLPAGSATRDPAEALVWYAERLDTRPTIAIVGAGHVGMALSRIMNQLRFRVLQFDHREELNTMTANEWAQEKRVVDFERIEESIPEDPELFIVLVSHGYRTDEIALRRLLRRKWKYLGMLGSKAKVEAMWEKLKADGYTAEELARVHAPIGLQINSRTPEEIAVSIAAEIIGIENAMP